MDRHRNISTSEVRALLQLANRLHLIHDPITRKKHLIEGLCQLVNASAGSCVVTHMDPETSKPTLVSTTEYRAPDVRGESLQLAPAAPDSTQRDERSATRRKTAMVQSSLNLRKSTVSVALNIFRYPLRGGQFSPRHRLLIDLFHTEMTWVYQADVLLTSPSALSLSPRARQTLQHLLEGLSEKQIAAKLHLSPNTVHHYVKSIHKHFSVSSRSELLARWVGK